MLCLKSHLGGGIFVKKVRHAEAALDPVHERTGKPGLIDLFADFQISPARRNPSFNPRYQRSVAEV
jgi:hypothetical protein